MTNWYQKLWLKGGKYHFVSLKGNVPAQAQQGTAQQAQLPPVGQKNFLSGYFNKNVCFYLRKRC